MGEWTRRGFAGLSAAAAALAGRTARAEGRYEVLVASDVMVRMRDGVQLATDIYRPARNGSAAPGRFPVILERTPYGKTVDSRSERTATNPTPRTRAEVAAFFVARGYVVI